MNWTSILNLFPLLVRLEPVLAKYGPAAIALYKADEPQALQLFGDVAAAIAVPNPVTWVSLAVKWGPILAQFFGTEVPKVEQFIADVKEALGTAPIPSIATPALPALPNLSTWLGGLPIPIVLPTAPPAGVPEVFTS